MSGTQVALAWAPLCELLIPHYHINPHLAVPRSDTGMLCPADHRRLEAWIEAYSSYSLSALLRISNVHIVISLPYQNAPVALSVNGSHLCNMWLGKDAPNRPLNRLAGIPGMVAEN